MKKVVALSVFLFAMLLAIPTVSAMAYGRDFSFDLRYGTDNDNDQCDAVRSEEIMTNYADIYVLSERNADKNVKFKVYAKNGSGSIIGTATNQRTYTSAYFKNDLQLTYNSTYLYKQGGFALYGNCISSDCEVAGNWVP